MNHLGLLNIVNVKRKIMKKYKLIKRYPNSPELGTIVDREWDEYGVQFGKHQEFWEEVVEKDYEILSFIATNDNKSININSDKNYLSWGGISFSLDKQLEWVEKGWRIIHSVKRLSDNTIFTIKDSTNNGTIEKFELSGDMIRVYFICKENYHVNLNTLKLNNPLFTTEDGIDIFINDYYWFIWLDRPFRNQNINTPYKIRRGTPLANDEEWSDDAKFFSTEKKAQEYIDNNKSLYSKKNMLDFAKMYRIKNLVCSTPEDIFKEWKNEN